jgi:hypothetical protein
LLLFNLNCVYYLKDLQFKKIAWERMLRTRVEGSDLCGKGCSLYRTPGPEPIEVNVTSFLVGISNFVI